LDNRTATFAARMCFYTHEAKASHLRYRVTDLAGVLCAGAGFDFLTNWPARAI